MIIIFVISLHLQEKSHNYIYTRKCEIVMFRCVKNGIKSTMCFNF